MGFKATFYKYFTSLEFCELIKEKCDEFLSFILHPLFHTVILIYSSLHVVFFLNLKFFHIDLVIKMFFCEQKILAFLLFLIFLFPVFNNSPHSIYENNCCIVSFDIIRTLRGIFNKLILREFLNIFGVPLMLLLHLISMEIKQIQ